MIVFEKFMNMFSIEKKAINSWHYFLIVIYLNTVLSRKLPIADSDVIVINLGYKSHLREKVPIFSEVLLNCSFDNPTWYKNNMRINIDSRQSKWLHFDKIKRTDGGLYSCKSEEEWSNLTLSVHPGGDAEFKNDDIGKLENIRSSIDIMSELIDKEPNTNNDFVINTDSTDDRSEKELNENENNKETTDIINDNHSAKIKGAPKFTNPEDFHSLIIRSIGSSAKFKCPAKGHPEPTTIWTKNEEAIIRKIGNVKIKKWGILLEELNIDDSGNYTCHVCNVYGCINFKEQLVVKDQNPVNFASNMEIYSQLSEDVENDDIDDYFEKDEFNSTNTNEMEDTNEHDIIQKNTNKTFKSNTAIKENEGIPRFTKPDTLIRLIAKPSGNMAKFKCAAEGNPEPNITWTKDGASISRSMGQVTFRKWGIILEDLVPKDSGQYTCIVCNIHGCVNFTAKLDVKDRVNHKPIITKVFQNQTLSIGSSVVFQCTVLSDLHLHIQWLFGVCENCSDKIILKTDTDNPEEFKLDNITYENEGWYTCVAANSLGHSAATAYLHVVDEIVDDPISAPINSNPIFTIAVIIISASFIVITLGIMYVQFRKIKHEKLMKHRAMETVHQWTKKIIIVKPAADTTNPELMQIPIVKIEKQRTTLVQTPSNDPNPFNEYEFPLDSNWEFSRSQLTLGPTLGEGAFGRVVMAEAHGLIKNAANLIVAVKMVKEGHTDTDMASLVREMEVMKMIGKHINIINLLGCCSQDGPLYVIVEYAPHGNLKDFLKKNRPTSEYEVGMTDDTEKKHILQKELISFAFQVGRGMEYLASRRCIHRDLAARNVLVSDDYVVKIADFGLARDIQESEYYRKNTNGRLPIKWMAPESLRDKFYDTQSDVWSYGVLLWEIMTYGEQPYPQVFSSEHLYEFLREGSRMDKPTRCSLNIYMLMRQCWNWNPQERPTFTEIVENLDKILGATVNEEYLDLGIPLLETPPSSDDDDSEAETLQEHSLLRYPY